MSIKALQDLTFTAKYARWNTDEKRRETWDEAVDRVMGMHRRRFAGMGVDAELNEVDAAMRARLVLGSQRALQFGGAPIERKEARLYNCSVSYCDRPRFFQEALWMLLCGCGVGFSVQRHHVAAIAAVERPSRAKRVFQVPDTIEGWADALGVLLSSYMVSHQPFPEYAGHVVKFDYSLVRPAGSLLSSGMGKAPGPDPLRDALENIRIVIEGRLSQDGSPTKLRPIDCYDIVMHASNAVLAGGVRRSATICVFSHDDQEMLTAKTGNWYETNPQRGRSNNSALLLRSSTSKESFVAMMKSVRQFGEPGFVWADHEDILFNPCVEIGMYPRDLESGQSGWSVCNLSEINVKACPTEDAFLRSCRAAALVGTFQAHYTSFPYLGPVSERIIKREALIGCSMTGMMDNPEIAFNPEIQRKGAELIKQVNADLAAKLHIQPAARTTCVKPAGSTSCILGTASGIHPHHARRYFRRMQLNERENILAYYQAHNPVSIERSAWGKYDKVITLCIEIPPDAITKNEARAIDMLERVKTTQQNWVEAGTRQEACVQPWLRHNVSNTIQVGADEWDAVTDYIFENRAYFAGISLLPEGGDLDYMQAPFCSVPTATEIVAQYGTGAIFASGLVVDGIHAFRRIWDMACEYISASDGAVHGAPSGVIGDLMNIAKNVGSTHQTSRELDTILLWTACSMVQGRIQAPGRPTIHNRDDDDVDDEVTAILGVIDWLRRAKKFADNYFGGNTTAMIHCVKRVHNAKMWEDIARLHQDVDFALMPEDTDTTKNDGDGACGGQGCDTTRL